MFGVLAQQSRRLRPTLPVFVSPPMTPLFSARVAHALDSQTPAHACAQHPGLNPAFVEEHSAFMDLGRARHSLLLGKGAEVTGIVAPDYKTKLARTLRDEARAAGKTPVLIHQLEDLQAWARAVRDQLAWIEAPIPFRGGEAEESIFWTEQGVECRATPDWRYHDNRTVDDLKTVSGSGHPGIFSRTLWDKGYDLQCALYRRGVKAVYGVEPDFRFIVCETEPPYAVSAVALDPEALAFANVKLDRALALWQRCLATGEWPAYPRRVCYAEVPAYLQAQFLERSYFDSEVMR